MFRKRFRKIRYNKKRMFSILFLYLFLLGMSLGYAFLTTTLSIEGVGNVSKATWDVHFENIQSVEGSVSPTTSPSISNNTTVSFDATLENPGEYYSFLIDIVNGGTINAMISSIEITPTLTEEQKKYFSYSVMYQDGTSIKNFQSLMSGTTETIKVMFQYIENADSSYYPDDDQNFSFSVSLVYSQANSSAIEVSHPESFADDDWETITSVVQSGNNSAYHVGDTKTVELGNGLGTHTLRIVNTTSPIECSTEGFSQTACGFVIEFADIIATHNMNSESTNVGGWPASEMRTYINTDIYNAIPETIRNAIVETNVVSGHGNTTGEENFISTDKLYLLSTHEVYTNVDGNTSSELTSSDTAYNRTRQLDYYSSIGVTDSSYSGAIKQKNDLNSKWWLRSATLFNTNSFNLSDSVGYFSNGGANAQIGVSPAFRIG